MYEPITVVKVRKETKITVPAGGWMLVGQPDEPLHLQLARRAELLKDGGVNDKYEKLLIGRLQATNPPAVFVTADGAKAAADASAKREESLAKNNAAANQRDAAAAKVVADLAAENQAEKLKAINAENDAIRNRDRAAAPALSIETK